MRLVDLAGALLLGIACRIWPLLAVDFRGEFGAVQVEDRVRALRFAGGCAAAAVLLRCRRVAARLLGRHDPSERKGSLSAIGAGLLASDWLHVASFELMVVGYA